MDHHLKSLSLVVRREHPKETAAIDHFLRKGELVPVLPGILRWAGTEETFDLRVSAVAKWDVDCILFGSTAAKVSWWPELKDETVRMSTTRRRKGVPWLHTADVEVPDDLVLTKGDSRIVSPELSIIQMCTTGDAAAISEGLRREVATLASLRTTLARLPSRGRSRKVVQRLLDEARDEPWSTLELDAHRQLREAGIDGWRTNVRLVVNGRVYFADVLFHMERLIVELDGRTHHTHAELDDNNDRRNILVTAGWRVLNFSGATLDSMVPLVDQLVRQARAAWKHDRMPPLPLAQAPVDSQDDGEWHIA